MAKTTKFWKWIFLGHRYLGLAASLLVAILAVTGWMLNHADGLGLSQRTVGSKWLLDWYGLAPESAPQSFPLGARWVTRLEQRIYLDDRDFAPTDSPLVGAVRIDGLFVLATSDSLLLVSDDDDAKLIERMTGASIPGSLRRIGVAPDGRLIAETATGVFRADAELLDWERTSADATRWSVAGAPPAALQEAVLRRFRGEGLPLSRVLLDLHSGRIFGRYGFLLMDGAALILLLLTGTGIYNWMRVSQFRPATRSDKR